MTKYLVREQVVNMFAVEMYPLIKDDEISLKRRAWDLYLEHLLKEGRVTESQRNIWVYPQKEMSKIK